MAARSVWVAGILRNKRLASRAWSVTASCDQRRKVTSSSPAEARGPLKVAIVGSGPAGMYAARTLLRKVQDVEVDLIEMLPTPYGLVRYGVAPDHADTKNVTAEFSQILSAPNCAFKGNVTVGKDVTIEELLRLFHAVVLAYGAEADRQLGIPGENLEGSISARDFVNWYNGHPHYTKFAPKLTAGEDAVIIGNGNVAIDVARVLLKPLDALRSTDIASHALETLGGSTISRVHIVGRRGPAQAAFTIAELREIVNLKGLNVRMRAEELALDEVDEAEMNKKRPLKRMLSLLQESFAAAKDPLVKKELHLRFLQSPTQATPHPHAETRVGAISLETNRLQGPTDARRAVGTGVMESLPCSLLMRSVGYRSLPLAGVAFDKMTHTVPHFGGSVLNTASSTGRMPGLYVAGWLKRGPSGIIGTNISDAQQTATALILDWQAKALHGEKDGGAGLAALLKSRHVRVVDGPGWNKIDAAEIARGAQQARPRCKFVCVEEMLQVADA